MEEKRDSKSSRTNNTRYFIHTSLYLVYCLCRDNIKYYVASLRCFTPYPDKPIVSAYQNRLVTKKQIPRRHLEYRCPFIQIKKKDSRCHPRRKPTTTESWLIPATVPAFHVSFTVIVYEAREHYSPVSSQNLCRQIWYPSPYTHCRTHRPSFNSRWPQTSSAPETE